MLAVLLPPAEVRIPLTFVAVVIALSIIGSVSANLGGSLGGRWLVPITLFMGMLAGIFLLYESVVTGHSGSASVWSGV
ncbi:hypothetical protein ABIB27_000996 [Arthrobacter sp. UYEF21]